MRVIAIDQGTSSTRGFSLDASGTCMLAGTREHKQFYPRPGWVEHDPAELLRHITECMEAAIAYAPEPVTAIGIDNQGESCLAWDGETGEPVSPVIVWQDRRTESVIEQLKSDGIEDLVMAKAGLPLDPYFSASKLAWIFKTIPEAKRLLSAGRLRLGTTDAFFIDRLTGVFATDITTASRTSLLNLATGQWDEELCQLFGVPARALPQIRPTMGQFGIARIGDQAIPVTAGVVDQQASLYGHGCRQTGDAKITFGTGAFALALTGDKLRRAPEKGLLPTIAWQSANKPPVYALDGGVYCASSALNWAKSLGLFHSFDEINAFDTPPAIMRHLAFVPALTGLGCPYWDGSAAGLWIGISLDTTASDLVQSILEGVALRAAQVINAMETMVPIGHDISIDGGMSANPYFCQFLSNVVQKRITVQSMAELTGLGTAQMALAALGHGGSEERPAATDTATQSQTTNYEPTIDLGESKALFTEAVEHSRNWRS